MSQRSQGHSSEALMSIHSRRPHVHAPILLGLPLSRGKGEVAQPGLEREGGQIKSSNVLPQELPTTYHLRLDLR